MRSKGTFVEICVDEELEKCLTRLLPRSYQMLNICKLSLQGRLPQDLMDMRVYKYLDNNSSTSDNQAFIVCIQKPNMCSKTGVITLPPAIPPSTEMIQAYENLFDWNEPIVFQSTPQQFLTNYLKPLCLKYAGHFEGRSCPCGLWALEKEAASQLQVYPAKNNAYLLRSLKENDVPAMMVNWHYSHDESEGLIKKQLDLLPTCGLFVENDTELASNLVVSPFGLFNILYTEDKHRGKGYAPLVIQWLAKEAATKLGLNTLLETEPTNDASQACLKRVGLKPVHPTTWYWYEPQMGAK